VKPEKLSIQELFTRERRFIIPLFQRSYVWNLTDQWEPLWEDIASRATAHLKTISSGSEAQVRSHFLGAVVFNVARVVGRSIARSDVIDGQQRLTTLQLFLTALRDQSEALEASEADLKLFSRLTKNPDCEDDSEEAFKVWPTNGDRAVFETVLNAGSVEAVHDAFARHEGALPRMASAYLYFAEQIEAFVELGADSEAVKDHFFALRQAIGKSLQLVVIELEDGDDPQVIFETLNARGQPLLPSDLIRNFVFMRITDEEADRLYDKYWRQFDELQADVADEAGERRFWHIEERQGRYTRPRIDLFIFHYLIMQTESDIRIGQLFKEFRDWRADDTASNEEFLADLKEASEHFRHLIVGQPTNSLELLAERLRALDTSTVYPLLLFFSRIRASVGDDVIDRAVRDLESFLIRRFVVGNTPKNYNRFFLSTLSKVKDAHRNKRDVADALRAELLRSSDDTAVWPNDSVFRRGWLSTRVYVKSRPDRSAMLLKALNAHMATNRNEVIQYIGPVTVEHLLPQKWELSDYPYGAVELPDDTDAEQYRTRLIDTVGNLTLLTGANNASAGNSPFPVKKSKIVENSDLRLNAWLRLESAPTSWGEADILNRGDELFQKALDIWPKPELRSAEAK
jgi:uncharacterized protein with ParB-like and HNH nuclease domain